MVGQSDPLLRPLADLLGYQLRRLSLMTMADLTAALEPLGIRPTESSVLFTIAGRPGVTQSEIGRALAIKRANMAPLIAGLEAQDLIARAPMDGRSQALKLTDKGAALHRRAQEITMEHERRCFAILSDDGRRTLAQQLREIWTAIDVPPAS